MKILSVFLLLLLPTLLFAQDFRTLVSYNKENETLIMSIKNISQKKLAVWNIYGVEPLNESHICVTFETKDTRKKFLLYFKLGGDSCKRTEREMPFLYFQPGEECVWRYKLDTYTKDYNIDSGSVQIVYGYIGGQAKKVERIMPNYIFNFLIR